MDIASLYQRFLTAENVSTDTRKIGVGSIFFALKGPNFNANALAAEALQKGARYAVIDELQTPADDRFILVDDVLTTLQELATHHRAQLAIPVIGLTGSNGKTTSKELLQAVLSKKFKTSATKGNLNNHIGVPLTILAIDKSVEIAVVEMGANHIGEIAALCRIANPTHGFITNIGRAHIGEFGSAENILRAKSELYQHLIQTDGTVFINSQDAVLSNMAKRFASPVYYPSKQDFYHCELADADPYLRVIDEHGTTIETQLTGNYNFQNVAAALCIGKYFHVPSENAAAALAEYRPGNMRSQIVTKGTNRIILDAYNANPSSMEAAIANLSAMQAAKKVAILGDMFELGDSALEEHQKLGSLLAKENISEVYVCGKLIKGILSTLPSAHYFEKQDELIAYLRQHPIKSATVLVKASRGMKFENLIDWL